MMTLRKPQSGSVAAIRDDLADVLVEAYRPITHARNLSTAFLAGNQDHRYAIGWDMAPFIDHATTTLINLVTVHELTGKWATFWAKQPTSAQTLTGATIDDLHENLRTAHRQLIQAASRAHVLAKSDATYSIYGSIGWDLETAVDDVVIAVRGSARAAGLADRRYWTGVL